MDSIADIRVTQERASASREGIGLLPSNAVVSGATIRVAGVSVEDAASEFGTPLYLFDVGEVRSRAETLGRLRLLHGARFRFGLKALAMPWLVTQLYDLGIGFDAVSGNELEVVSKYASGADIAFHGNAKSEAEIRAAIAVGAVLVVDHPGEVDLAVTAARDLDLRGKVMIRINPMLDYPVHPHLATGAPGSKFGLLPGEAYRVGLRVVANDRLELVGLHCHIGSQISDPRPFLAALDVLVRLAQEIGKETGWTPSQLSPGGGFAVPYAPGDAELDVSALVAQCTELVHAAFERNPPGLVFEPGRWLVARSGIAVYRVVNTRVREGVVLVALDGGIGDNPRPELYQAKYFPILVGLPRSDEKGAVQYVGRYCEAGDVMSDPINGEVPRPGDLVAFPSSGAYQLGMSSNYNMIGRPAVATADRGKLRLVQRREQLEDILARDVS